MKEREELKMSEIISITTGIVLIVLFLLTLFKSEEYAKYLSLGVWLSAIAGFALYFVEEEESA